jgi:predicted acetyltransferase
MSSHPGFAPVVRPVAEGEWDAWNAIDPHAFGGEEPPERVEFWNRALEPDRCIGAYEGNEPVGSAAAFSFAMTVPGGASVPVAGISAVGVLPTHRRRGVLRALMRHQLDGLHENGEFVAALTASEPAIYGRFGYGLASWRMSLRIARAAAALPAEPAAPSGLRLRLADPAASLDTCLKVYEELLGTRSGLMPRAGAWKERMALDPPADREGASPLRCVLAEVDGQVRGYAYYATVVDWDATGPTGTTLVREAIAADPAIRLALWRYLFDLDLMTAVKVDNLPLDDELLFQLADPRAAVPSFRDALFVRLVEVGKALEARTYSAPVDVVLDVEDPFCPWNTGRWRLSGDAAGARCERTADAAELRLGAVDLGSLYLDGVSPATLAAAGRISELRPGALAELGRACAPLRLPWMSFGF